jgi:superfamily II DNA or RNA helicase
VSEFSEGQVIQAPFLAGPAEVKNIEERTGYHQLEVVLQESGEFRTPRLTPDQLEKVELVDQSPNILNGDPEEFFLSIEAHRIRLAHQFDPMLAVSVSQVDPLPHQIEAVYHHALQMPRLRFMIADDAGAGKTIMAGLILKEMQQRGLVERVLVVSPGHLKDQWRREMKERFNTTFTLVNRQVVRSNWRENVWREHPKAIASIDFLKQDDIEKTLKGARWDLIIVDEAHKMSAYAYETKEGTKIDKTQRYQVGEVLSEQTEHMLFLTATPHKGDEENFRLFLDLLRPGFFAKEELLQESVEEGENPLFVRRLKEDMRKFNGEPIFPPRHVRTAQFPLTTAEKKLYNDVTSYIRNFYDKAKEEQHYAFTMVILQRRLTSSVHAILSSLERRREKLEDYLEYPEKIRKQQEEYREIAEMTEEEIQDLPEEERDRVEEKLEELTIAQNIDEVREEIAQLDPLIEQATRVRDQGTESKLKKLQDDILSQLDGRKLLIFTEHKDTLSYLEETLRDWGYSVSIIHGGMSLDARIDAEKEFQHESQIMVATEAAGEGINLQFCSLMVNYDIPWNPNRLEQRMGRIHRYGQDREVYIWNLIAEDTREGQILDKLFNKLSRMRNALGTDRVFDIIGDVIPGTNLTELLKDALFNQRRMEEIEFEIEKVDQEETQETLEDVMMSSLATRHIDYSGLMEEQMKAEENRLVPEYVQDYFLRAFSHMDGSVEEIEHGFRIDTVPYDLRQRNDDPSFKNRFGKVRRSYNKVTFEKEVSRTRSDYEFVAPGHPLLEALNEVVLTDLQDSGTEHAVFQDPVQGREGLLWFIEGVVLDGTGDEAGRRVFAVHQDKEGTLQRLNPAVLWDLEPMPEADVPDFIDELIDDREEIEDYLMAEVLFPYRNEIADDRQQDAEIKERYGLRSLEYLIAESNQKLMDYYERQDGGENMELPIRNEERNLERLETRKEELDEEIELESSVTVEEPKVMGIAALIPAPANVTYEVTDGEQEIKDDAGQDYMARNEEIEAVGMEEARAYEEAQGWQVEDVSKEDHGGFDLRSLRFSEEDGSHEGTRYIEVKARARSGKIRLTANEWKKARKFEDQYWIYVVTQAASENPELTRIQNPAQTLEQGEDVFATGFEIPEKRWREKKSVE